MLSNGQLGKQPSNGQFDQNLWNKLSHTSFGTYPPKPLRGPPLTMHK